MYSIGVCVTFDLNVSTRISEKKGNLDEGDPSGPLRIKSMGNKYHQQQLGIITRRAINRHHRQRETH